MNTSWYKFLVEQLSDKEDTLLKNCRLILSSLKNRAGVNTTARTLKNGFVLNRNEDNTPLSEDESSKLLAEFFIHNNLDSILSKYKIDSFVGAGAVGAAFSLKEPHENYVLKIQISDSSNNLRNYGVEYPEELFKKQQSGKYNPKEINVLESTKVQNAEINPEVPLAGDVIIFVYSKVEQTIYSGKTSGKITSRQAYDDFSSQNGFALIRILLEKVEKDKNPDEATERIADLISTEIVGKLFTTSDRVIVGVSRKIVELFQQKGIKRALEYFYSTRDTEYLSKSQFVNLGLEYYSHMRRVGDKYTSLDFHGGNFGFRRGTDIPLSFDV